MSTNMETTHERFEEVVALAGAAMLGFARRRADPETAADVVADALLVVWRRIDEVPPGKELPWTIGVTRRCLANADRAVRRQRNVVARLAALPSPSTVSSSADRDVRLHTALARLNARDREILRLWAWDDLGPAQIAIALHIDTNTASVRLHRAKRRLATAFESSIEEEPRRLPRGPACTTPGRKRDEK